MIIINCFEGMSLLGSIRRRSRRVTMKLVISTTLVVVVILLFEIHRIISWTIIVPTYNYCHHYITSSSALPLLSPWPQICGTSSYTSNHETKMRANSKKCNDDFYTCCNNGIHNLSNRTSSKHDQFHDYNISRKQILSFWNRLFLLCSSTAGQPPSYATPSIIGNRNPRSISTSIASSSNSDHGQLLKLRSFHHPYYYDIPRKPPNTIRLYLIRHGQTENNRLNIVQGAHVDTPLNDRGKLQATLLGQALIALQQQHRLHDADHDENGLVFLHSAYQRSQETATIAASTYYFNNANYYNYRNNMQELSSIGTIDFGLQEKKKYEMNQIYSSWSLGLIDVKLVDGETCRQVMERILQSFHSIVKLSSSKFNDTHSKPQEDQYQYQRDVVAILHRKFIRMMLAIALDIPLFQAFTTLQQRNGCMNILDISTTETITWVASQSKLFLGSRRQLQLNNGHDFQMILPKINVIKVDDNRHLDGYISQQQK